MRVTTGPSSLLRMEPEPTNMTSHSPISARASAKRLPRAVSTSRLGWVSVSVNLQMMVLYLRSTTVAKESMYSWSLVSGSAMPCSMGMSCHF